MSSMKTGTVCDCCGRPGALLDREGLCQPCRDSLKDLIFETEREWLQARYRQAVHGYYSPPIAFSRFTAPEVSDECLKTRDFSELGELVAFIRRADGRCTLALSEEVET